MDLLGRVPPSPPPRSIKTRSQDCAGSLGNSSACWSWHRGPWHLSHPGSLVRGEHVAPGKAELHLTSILSFGALFQYEEKQQQSEVRFPSFQRTTVGKGGLSCQVGGESWQGEALWQNQE